MPNQPIVSRRHIALPAARHYRIALLHQETVSGILFSCRIIARACAHVEYCQGARIAAIYNVVKKSAIATGHVDGLEDQDIDAVFHALGGIQRCLIDIYDAAVQVVAPIEFAVSAANEFFILANVGERSAAEGGRLHPIDDDPGYSGIRSRDTDEKSEKDGDGQLGVSCKHGPSHVSCVRSDAVYTEHKRSIDFRTDIISFNMAL
jgi:hypothetical protein